MPPLYESESYQPPKLGLWLLQGLIIFIFFVFGLRFWYLQIHRGEEFSRMARENQLRKETIYAPRGLLRDRNGKLLAVNEPSYALALVREDCKDIDKTLLHIAEITGRDLDQLKEKYEQGRRLVKAFEPMILVPELPFELLARIEANALFWPGLEIVHRPRRHYPYGSLMAHILGYVAEASQEEMQDDKSLRMGDSVGKQGLEYVLEQKLRGAKGVMQLEVDATGRDLTQRVLREPKAGDNVVLSIDLELQRFVTEQLRGMAGGVVVMDPDNGQLLALVTQPSYDNNLFTAGLSNQQWEALQLNPRHPLQNRVIQSVYPPGSIWKLLMAAAGLSQGFIRPSDTVFCTGSYQLGRRVFRCWKKGGHGRTDLRKALVESCDVYFYQLGERMGVDRIHDYAEKCGFGEPTGIDLPHEKGGLAPSREWKRRRFGEPWHGGENLNLAIGQGYTLVQPLQVARFLSALVNGGKLLKPNLLKDAEETVQAELPLSDEHRRTIVDAMVDTVASDHGTCRRIRRPDAVLGGKTGTAQVVKIAGEERRDKDEMPYMHRDHAWMASFGERKGKRYVVVVMIEHGGHGGSAGGPISKAIYDKLFGPVGGRAGEEAMADGD